jgi:predicted HTH transcriptional regulator
VVTSYGGLVEGLSVDEFFSGRSMPRNRELMRVFHDLDFVEQLGSGMNRILNAYDKSIFHLSDNFIEIVFPFEKGYLHLTDQGKKIDNSTVVSVTDQVTEQVTEQVKRLIVIVGNKEMSIKEIMEGLKLKHRPTVVYDYVRPAILLGIIELTQPYSPKSPTQKYRLTDKGINLKQET